MNEQDQFLKDLENDQTTQGVDFLDQPLNPEPAKEEGNQGGVETTENTLPTEPDGEDDEEGAIAGIRPRNRKERRRLTRLKADADSSIFLAGKLAAQSDAKSAITEESDYIKSVERIYGNTTPEAVLATDLLKKALIGARDDAENRAYGRIKAEREQEAAEVKSRANEIYDLVESVEDAYSFDFTDTQEKSFIQLLTKMSPKDAEGRVVKYADPNAVFEIFQERLKSRGTDSRAKDLSARSMVKSGASKESTLPDDTHARFLRENGII